MVTFNGNKDTKQLYVRRAAALVARVTDNRHRDTLFWTHHRWCPSNYVCGQRHEGCEHRFYADEVGVPVALAYAERQLFLELPVEEAKTWPLRFVNALAVGADLDAQGVWRDLALYMLTDADVGLERLAYDADHVGAVASVATLFDDETKDEAAINAVVAEAESYRRGITDDGRDQKSDEARRFAGCFACESAAQLAASLLDPRCAANAIHAFVKAHRRAEYATYVGARPDPEKDTRSWDQNGIQMVNLGEAMWNSGRWYRLAEAGNAAGEQEAHRCAHLLSNHTLRVLNPHPVRRFFGSLFERAA